MIIPVKKLKNGFSLPTFGFGTWQMGGRNDRDFSNDDKADIEAIQSAVNQGITHIDTAEVYADGYTEKLVAQAIKPYERSKLFLVSKVMPQNLGYKDLISHFKKSLKRLSTDYLDLYLIHRPNPKVPLNETIKALNDLVKQGVLRNIGVANFNKESLQKAQSTSSYPIVVNQAHYNLIYREVEETGLLKYCQENDVILMAWRPIEKGVVLDVDSQTFDNICKKYNKTKSQVAINWLISQKNVVTLAKSRSIEHLKENLGGVNWQMDDEDIEILRKEFPNQQKHSNSYLKDPDNFY